MYEVQRKHLRTFLGFERSDTPLCREVAMPTLPNISPPIIIMARSGSCMQEKNTPDLS